jgi:hypothetical protein
MFTTTYFRIAALALGLCIAGTLGAADAPEKLARPIDKGQRVFTAGWSLHNFIPGSLKDMAQSAGRKDHVVAGVWPHGYTEAWKYEERSKLKQLLRDSKVDVLTLVVMNPSLKRPEPGIDDFLKFALEHNPEIRFTLQASWLNYDEVPAEGVFPKSVDRDARTIAELRKNHAEYFQIVAKQVADLNKQTGKQVVHLVPVGQATLALREKIIAGQAPGLKKQQDLFRDAAGHAQDPLELLTVYCHYAVIYRSSPVGQPMPALLKRAKNPDWDEKLNRLLQELAWDAVLKEPLSGVKAAP